MTAPLDRRMDSSVAIPFLIFTLIWGSTWLVIRGQLGTVSPHWSVAYRFLIAAAGMAVVARFQGHSLRPSRDLLAAAGPVALMQFSINFNSVYLAERHITSGLVATVFALLIVPNSLLGWLFLGQRPNGRFAAGAALACAGVGLLFVQEMRGSTASPAEIGVGLAFTLLGLLGASGANVYQATHRAMRVPLPVMLAWSMAIGAAIDVVLAWMLAGPPTGDPRASYWLGLAYLALAASVICFSLYFPVVRKIGPARAAYSSVLVPIIAMTLSTLFEGYRWTALAGAGAVFTLGGMVLALGGRRGKAELVTAPDAA